MSIWFILVVRVVVFLNVSDSVICIEGTANMIQWEDSQLNSFFNNKVF